MARVTECETGKITKVRYVVAVKKEGIIIGDLPREISCSCRITVAILTLCNGFASLGFALCSGTEVLVLHDLPKLMCDKMERDNVSLGLEYLLYVEIFQQ